MEPLKLTDIEIGDLAITLQERFNIEDGANAARLNTIKDTIRQTLLKWQMVHDYPSTIMSL